MDFEKVSKIDFSKCKMDNWDGELVEIETYESSLITLSVHKFGVFAYFARVEKRWTYDCIHFWCDIETAKSYTDQVDAFIASETARIEAEDEAANWVAVPWQDVEFLVSSGTTVANSLYAMNPKTVGVPSMEYTADRRTFPAGYDPEKPRWVEVTNDQVYRLERSGCVMAIHTDQFGWFQASKCDDDRRFRYAVDIHTLKPGVPLHEEPKPKPAPRQCSKEFALRHPKESEARYAYKDYNSGWDQVDTFDFTGSDRCYEFRTTAKAEVKSRVVAEVAVSDVVPGITANGNVLLNAITHQLVKGLKQVVVFEVALDCFEVAKGKNPRIALIVDEG